MPPVSSPRRTGARRRPRIGQNFLSDRRVAKRIVDAARIAPDEDALEIGPGRGALTHMLAMRASKLVAVELDPDLAHALSAKLGESASVSILSQNALHFDPSAHFSRPYKMVANLPYYVATPIIRRYLTLEPRPACMVVMVQREVAENIAAAPGNMSFLSVAVQMYATARVLFSVPPRAFRPIPKVTSAVVRIEPRRRAAVPVDDVESFMDFAAAGFRAPRKQLRNSLRIGLDAPAERIDRALDSAGIDGRRRPATLSLPELAALYTLWSDQC